ncbi:hypothetical protein SAY86_010412 [Trapa natans]|uniref:Protein kinase domain-containing protein n=1 Tax=Trapa natans TaxID=22666 RepID=A0AAN7LKI3_TRANT|nr:hypothetical protein SAY86_010412 [Trapa natans]
MQTIHYLNGLSLFLPFILCLFGSSAISDTTDSVALLAFKSSLIGATAFPVGWDNSSSPCLGSWTGVSCDPPTGRVTRLILEGLDLTGDLRQLGRLSELRFLSLKLNRFSSLPLNLSVWPNLKQLYLSHNEFGGSFPAGITHLRRLRRLDLSHNNFSGTIPLADLSRLPRLLTLRLEANSFTGTLAPDPPSASIADFNVSGNRLVGQIPDWLSRFPATAYAGNKNLCGKPLPYNCTDHHKVTIPEEEPLAVSAPRTHHSRGIKKLLVFIAVDAVAGLGVIFIIIWCCFRNRRSKALPMKEGIAALRRIFGQDPVGILASNNTANKEGMVIFEGCKGFVHVADLLKASAELLGKGCVGTTYKVAVEGAGGPLLAVKRVRPGRWWQGTRWRREVDGCLKLIGKLRHQNLVSLRAYYHSMEELLLVYDYIPMGSLYSLLHENRGPGRSPVDWTARIKIASNSARALAFLHQHSKAKLFHGHLTTSNILIDRSGNALISDTGLAHLFLPAPSNHPNQAPELIKRRASSSVTTFHPRYTQHCDVYSFGVILLEILTGKADTGEGETNLVNWIRGVWQRRGPVKEVFDFEVFMSEEKEVVESEMTAVLQVALQCLANNPRDRPKMGAVLGMIEDIRRANGGAIGSSSDLGNPSYGTPPTRSEMDM